MKRLGRRGMEAQIELCSGEKTNEWRVPSVPGSRTREWRNRRLVVRRSAGVAVTLIQMAKNFARHRARIHPSHSGRKRTTTRRDKELPPNQRSTVIDAQPPRTRSCCVLNLVTPFNNYLLPQPRRSCLAQCVPMNSKHPLRYQICLNLAYRGLAPRIEMANRLDFKAARLHEPAPVFSRARK